MSPGNYRPSGFKDSPMTKEATALKKKRVGLIWSPQGTNVVVFGLKPQGKYVVYAIIVP